MVLFLRAFLITFASLNVFLTTAATARAQSTLFVDANAPSAGNGQSWATPLRNLQVALTIARGAGGAVTEIRVAQGTYRPAPPGGDRTVSFALVSGVALRGGYAGFGQPDPNKRDIALYQSVLSGDLDSNDGVGFSGYGENSYHVVTGSGTDAMAVLDGFTILAGNADGPDPDLRGGGMFNNGGSPTVRRCTFRQNKAWLGAALNNENSSPTVTGCVFEGNSAGFSGGAIRGWHSSPIVANCLFVANTAESGGAMWFGASTPTIERCTFFANSASEGNALALSSCCPKQPSNLHASNCIFWDGGNEILNTDESIIIISYSDIQGGWDGTGNIDADPRFMDPGYWDDKATPDDPADDFWVDGDLRLQHGSPCINSGDPGFVPAPSETDLDGHARVLCERVDMGAYEFGIGDDNCDQAISPFDFAGFPGCMNGPPGSGSQALGCDALDFNFDSYIDLSDYAGFQNAMTDG